MPDPIQTIADIKAGATPADDTTDPVAKPWYLSKGVVAGIAGIVMALAPKASKLLGYDIGLTQEQANEIVLFIIPQAIALYGRIVATHKVTGSATAAKVLNDAAVASGVPTPAS